MQRNLHRGGARAAHQVGEREGHVAEAGAEVEYAHAGLDAGQAQQQAPRFLELTRLLVEPLDFQITRTERVARHERFPSRSCTGSNEYERCNPDGPLKKSWIRGRLERGVSGRTLRIRSRRSTSVVFAP